MRSYTPAYSAAIWGAPSGCTATGYMCAQLPKREKSEAQKHGIAAHWVAEQLIMEGKQGTFPQVVATDYLCKVHPETGVVIDLDIFESAHEYAKGCVRTMQELGAMVEPAFGVESRGVASRICPSTVVAVDFYAVSRERRLVTIRDFKHGHRLVEVFRNLQLAYYWEVVRELLRITPAEAHEYEVEFVISQPRGYHVDGTERIWRTDHKELEALVAQLITKAQQARSAPKCTTGPHCASCPARHDCEAALVAGMQLYSVTQDPMPLSMSGQALGLYLWLLEDAARHIDALRKQVADEVEARLQEGGRDPVAHYTVEQQYSRPTWTTDRAALVSIAKVYGVDIVKGEAPLLTPTQAKNAGLPAPIVAQFSGKVPTGKKLKRIDTDNLSRLFK